MSSMMMIHSVLIHKVYKMIFTKYQILYEFKSELLKGMLEIEPTDEILKAPVGNHVDSVVGTSLTDETILSILCGNIPATTMQGDERRNFYIDVCGVISYFLIRPPLIRNLLVEIELDVLFEDFFFIFEQLYSTMDEDDIYMLYHRCADQTLSRMTEKIMFYDTQLINHPRLFPHVRNLCSSGDFDVFQCPNVEDLSLEDDEYVEYFFDISTRARPANFLPSLRKLRCRFSLSGNIQFTHQTLTNFYMHSGNIYAYDISQLPNLQVFFTTRTIECSAPSTLLRELTCSQVQQSVIDKMQNLTKLALYASPTNGHLVIPQSVTELELALRVKISAISNPSNIRKLEICSYDRSVSTLRRLTELIITQCSDSFDGLDSMLLDSLYMIGCKIRRDDFQLPRLIRSLRLVNVEIGNPILTIPKSVVNLFAAGLLVGGLAFTSDECFTLIRTTDGFRTV